MENKKSQNSTFTLEIKKIVPERHNIVYAHIYHIKGLLFVPPLVMADGQCFSVSRTTRPRRARKPENIQASSCSTWKWLDVCWVESQSAAPSRPARQRASGKRCPLMVPLMPWLDYPRLPLQRRGSLGILFAFDGMKIVGRRYIDITKCAASRQLEILLFFFQLRITASSDYYINAAFGT